MAKKIDPIWKQAFDLCMKDFKEGLKLFGTYQYEDKGAGEIIDLFSLTELLKELGPEGAAWVISKICKTRNGERFASDLLTDLDTWGDVDDDSSPFNQMFAYLSEEAKDLY